MAENALLGSGDGRPRENCLAIDRPTTVCIHVAACHSSPCMNMTDENWSLISGMHEH